MKPSIIQIDSTYIGDGYQEDCAQFHTQIKRKYKCMKPSIIPLHIIAKGGDCKNVMRAIIPK